MMPAVSQSRRKLDGDARRMHLLDAALHIFSEKGFERASLQDIADRIGILKGSLYYYFKSKDAILFAVLKQVHDEHLENARRLSSGAGRPLARLRRLLSGHALFVCNNLARATVLSREIRKLPRSRVKDVLGPDHAYQRLFGNLIVEAQAAGEIAAQIDPRLATLWILGALNSIHRWYQPQEAMTAAAACSQFAEQLTRGLTRSPLWQGRATGRE